MIENLREHFIIGGYGRVGRRAAEDLVHAELRSLEDMCSAGAVGV